MPLYQQTETPDHFFLKGEALLHGAQVFDLPGKMGGQPVDVQGVNAALFRCFPQQGLQDHQIVFAVPEGIRQLGRRAVVIDGGGNGGDQVELSFADSVNQQIFVGIVLLQGGKRQGIFRFCGMRERQNRNILPRRSSREINSI